MGEWKGIRQNLLKKNPELKTELYHLESDPSESNDVADEHPEIVKQIEQLFDEQHINSEIFRFPAIDTK